MAAEDRSGMWTRIRHSYPGGDESSWRPDYMAYEFEDDDGHRLLYVEVWC